MNWSPSEGTRREDAPPWEPFTRFLDGRLGAADFPGAARKGRARAYGSISSRGTTEVKSDRTRRGVIYQYIREHPGAHVRGVEKELRLATGDLHYHLFWLEKHGFVKTKKSGFHRYVFPTMVFRDDQEVLLGVLSHETPREMLLTLVLDAAMTQSALARRLGHSQPTTCWHLQRLIELGVVGKRRTSGGTFYAVTADRDDLLSFVKSYHPRVWKRWEGRLGDLAASVRVKRADKGGSLQGSGAMPPAVVELIGKRWQKTHSSRRASNNIVGAEGCLSSHDGLLRAAALVALRWERGRKDQGTRPLQPKGAAEERAAARAGVAP